MVDVGTLAQAAPLDSGALTFSARLHMLGKPAYRGNLRFAPDRENFTTDECLRRADPSAHSPFLGPHVSLEGHLRFQPPDVGADMPEPNYVQKVAARRAALPRSPVLDFVDYMLAVCGVDRAKLQELSKQETFLACVARYGTLFLFPLGYLAFYFLKHRVGTEPAMDDAPRHFILFQGLDYKLSSLALKKLADDVASGRHAVPPDLKQKYPEIYVLYQPENYGDDYL
jgi:hypothetical protein